MVEIEWAAVPTVDGAVGSSGGRVQVRFDPGANVTPLRRWHAFATYVVHRVTCQLPPTLPAAPFKRDPVLKLPHDLLRCAVLAACVGASGNAAAQATDPAPTEKEEAAKPPATPVTKLDRVEVSRRAPLEPSGQTSLTQEEILRTPGAGNDPMRAVQSLPGMAVNDDASAEPAVRGSRPTDNAYYVDFLPVGYAFHAGGLVSVFNPDLVKRFDLYSSSFGPQYGDVIGAVFDIGLRDPRTDKLGGVLDVSFLSASVLAEGPVAEDMSFYLAARRSYLDLFIKTVQDNDVGVTAQLPVYGDYQGKFLWRLSPTHRLSLNLLGASDRNALTVKSDGNLGLQDPVLAGNANFKTSYQTLAVVSEIDLPSGLSNRLALGQNKERNETGVGTAVSANVETTNYYLREELRVPIGTQHEALFGGSLASGNSTIDLSGRNARCTEFEPDCDFTSAPLVTTQQRIRANFVDAYVNDRYRFLPNWVGIAGLRYSYDNYLRKSYVDPRVGVEWEWSADTLLSAAWGTYNQFPDREQVIRDWGNPGLLRQRSTATTLGVTQRLDRDWSWKLDLYNKQFSDLVVADPTQNYINAASGTSRGVEILIRREPTSRLSGYLSLTMSKSKRTNDLTGQTFPFDYDQPVIAHLVATWKQSERWQYGLQWSYHTGAPFTPIVGTGLYPDGRVRPIYGGLNSERLPAYQRLDLRVDNFVTPNFSWYAELINAYAAKNVAGYTYNADYTVRTPVYQLPLLLSIGVQYRF